MVVRLIACYYGGMQSAAVLIILSINVLLTGFCAYCLGFAVLQRLDPESPQYRIAEQYMRSLQVVLVGGAGLMLIALFVLLWLGAIALLAQSA